MPRTPRRRRRTKVKSISSDPLVGLGSSLSNINPRRLGNLFQFSNNTLRPVTPMRRRRRRTKVKSRSSDPFSGFLFTTPRNPRREGRMFNRTASKKKRKKHSKKKKK